MYKDSERREKKIQVHLKFYYEPPHTLFKYSEITARVTAC